MTYVRIEFDNGKESKDLVIEHAKFCSALREIEAMRITKRAEKILALLQSSAPLKGNVDINSFVSALIECKMKSDGFQIGEKLRQCIGYGEVPEESELRVSLLRDFPFSMDEEPLHEFYEFVKDDKVLYAISQAEFPKALAHLEKYQYAHAASILRHWPNSKEPLTETEARTLKIASGATAATKRVLIASLLSEGVTIRPLDV